MTKEDHPARKVALLSREYVQTITSLVILDIETMATDDRTGVLASAFALLYSYLSLFYPFWPI